MTTFDFEPLFAQPMQPCIRVRISPTETIEVDRIKWELEKKAFEEFVRSIPHLNGASWKLLRPYTGGNGQHAKLLIALGDLLGLWTMHPSVNLPELWSGTNFYPTILADSLRAPAKAPEVEETCPCCNREMGPVGSRQFNILKDSLDPDGRCEECAHFCTAENACVIVPPELQIRPAAPKQKPTPIDYDALQTVFGKPPWEDP